MEEGLRQPVVGNSDLHVRVSRRIKEDFDSGEEYYALHGKRLRVVPPVAGCGPSAEFIRWHNEKRFMAV